MVRGGTEDWEWQSGASEGKKRRRRRQEGTRKRYPRIKAFCCSMLIRYSITRFGSVNILPVVGIFFSFENKILRFVDWLIEKLT